MGVLVDESRSYSQNTLRQILTSGIEKYYFVINLTTENSFEILYTVWVLCGHENELSWNTWRERQAG